MSAIPPQYKPAALPKLNLSPANCIDMFGVIDDGYSGSRYLFDEQELAGDPASGKGGDVASSYMPGWSSWMYPNDGDTSANDGQRGLIDLETLHSISDIWLNHYNGIVQAKL